MELVGYLPRVMVAEKRISASTKYGARLHRPPKPPLKIKTVHLEPYQADPPDRGAGTLTVCVIRTGQDVVLAEDDLNDLAFTPAEAGPGGPTAAADQDVPSGNIFLPARKELPASRRIKPVRKTAPRTKGRRETRAEEIARLERELAELEAEDDGREPE